MFDAILERIGTDLADRAWITVAGLTIYPGEGCARVKLEAGDDRFAERDGVFRNADGLRTWAAVLTAVADEVEAAEARAGGVIEDNQQLAAASANA